MRDRCLDRCVARDQLCDFVSNDEMPLFFGSQLRYVVFT